MVETTHEEQIDTRYAIARAIHFKQLSVQLAWP